VVGATAVIYGTMLFTNFPSRAGALADEIAADRPDLIGLQEVSQWVATPLHAGPTPPSLDFLNILQAQLAARGLNYVVAGTAENATIGPVPLVAPPFGCGLTATDCVVSLHDRDVILVNADVDGLTVASASSGHFNAQATVLLPGASAPLSFDRGWVAIDADLDGKQFRFVNTHLEVEDIPVVQEAQARELLAGPTRPDGTVIAVGDFNSAADGSTTKTYRFLVKGVYADAWSTNPGDRGATCCQNETLTNPQSQLSERIDLVLTRAAVPLAAHLVGATAPFEPQPPFWPSDHAGVVAEVALP
jgi:endonuclease/exonuclease/phosphatase family metal-dependent hydrolase